MLSSFLAHTASVLSAQVKTRKGVFLLGTPADEKTWKGPQKSSGSTSLKSRTATFLACFTFPF
jgi:hypothetical protein